MSTIPPRMMALALLLAVPAAWPALPARAESHGAAFRVIVNPGNPIAAIERRFLADAFLKKATRWANGEAILAVDLEPDSPVRVRFSEEVLKRSVAAVKSYWQQLVFAGRDVPPPELDRDEDVVRFVLRHPGAVGYVSSGAALDRARVVTVR